MSLTEQGDRIRNCDLLIQKDVEGNNKSDLEANHKDESQIYTNRFKTQYLEKLQYI